MDKENGRTVLLGMRYLQQVSSASPRAIYWGFMASRGKTLEMASDTPEHLVLVRLACLTRASGKEIDNLQTAWRSITKAERDTLIAFFLADGIEKATDILVFLPLYFEAVKNNPTIGLSLAFEVLAGVIETRRLVVNEDVLPGSGSCNVNLSDLGSFSAT